MKRLSILLIASLSLGFASLSQAANYAETRDVFKNAGVSAAFFRHAYPYARAAA